LVDVERSFESVIVADVEAELDFLLDAAVLQCDRSVCVRLSVTRRVDVTEPAVGGGGRAAGGAIVPVFQLDAVGVHVDD